MTQGWDDFEPAPIKKFHGEAMKRFQEVKDSDHKIGGIQFNELLVEFKVKVMRAYGITSDPIPKARG